MILSFLASIRDALKDVKTCRFPSRIYRIKAFIILVKLHMKCHSGHGKQPVDKQNILLFKISAPSYNELLLMFKEIALKLHYFFHSTKKDIMIIDCGAHVGMSVLYFKILYPKSVIYAFEPDPDNYKLLLKNISQNKIRNVKTFNCALSSQEGVVDYYPAESSLEGSLLQMEKSKKPCKTNSIRLSSLLSNRTFDIAKIDAKGIENDIVTDLIQTKTLANIEHYFITHYYTPSDQVNFKSAFETCGFKKENESVHYEKQENKLLTFHKFTS